jgi:hypothetical protein
MSDFPCILGLMDRDISTLELSQYFLGHPKQHYHRQHQSGEWEEDRWTNLVGKHPGQGRRDRIEP